MTTNVLLYYIVIHTFASVYELSLIFQATVSLVTFIRLRQANALLRNLAQTSVPSQSTYTRAEVHTGLSLFYVFHASIRRSVASQATITGPNLLLHLLVYTPCNAFMVWSLLLHSHNLITAILFWVCVWAQIIYIFGIHLLVVQYPKRLHACARWLLALAARMKTTKGRRGHLRERLKLCHAIQMLNVRRQYGVNYGKAGQLVTFAVFLKFLQFYLKMMFYSYKINR